MLLNNCWQFGAILLLNKQWQFGALLLLNKRWRFGDHVLLNTHWQFGFIAKCLLAILRQPIANHMLAILATSETIELVAFIGLEGVNYVFSHVSLILVATFLFKYFCKIVTY